VAIVLEAEHSAGREPRDVSEARLGYDVVSRDQGALRFVKVSIGTDADTARMERNAALACLNTQPAYWIALVDTTSRSLRWARPRVDWEASFSQGWLTVGLE